MEVELFFPNMPREVFEQFIQPQLKFDIESLTVLEAFITAPGWAKYFRNKPFHFWKNVTWRKLSLPYKDVHLDPVVVNLACQLVNDFRKSGSSQAAERANVENSKARFDTSASFMESFGEFPKPIVCLDVQTHWDILDGYHRLAALLSREEHDEFPFEVWLGTSIP